MGSFKKPISSELGLAYQPLFGGDGITRVVLPYSVDLEESLGHALLADTELRDYPAARGVSRDDGDLDPVQGNRFEGELKRDDDCFGYESSTSQ
jgi:hypothetical protein